MNQTKVRCCWQFCKKNYFVRARIDSIAQVHKVAKKLVTTDMNRRFRFRNYEYEESDFVIACAPELTHSVLVVLDTDAKLKYLISNYGRNLRYFIAARKDYDSFVRDFLKSDVFSDVIECSASKEQSVDMSLHGRRRKFRDHL